jgi:hypothetical protein
MKSLFRLTWLYLLIPFMLFCLGWLRLTIAIPVIALLLWTLWKLWKSTDKSPSLLAVGGGVMWAVLLTGLWVFFSGVGGYAFQNYDFHGRNAILRDLIDFEWPVAYSEAQRGRVRMLVYYTGYWLPAALAGKLFGWDFANAVLFIWAWLGAALAGLHLGSFLKTSFTKAAFLLIGFSGLDALGTILFTREYPALWPPVQHLEIWAGILQFSSFTTQLFWVFNQAVPAWLCILLLLNDPRRDAAALAWALCFFFAPLVSIGLLPFALVKGFGQSGIKRGQILQEARFDLLPAAAAIAALSYFYFSSNTAAQDLGWQSLPWVEAARFILFEAGIFWFLLAPLRWRDPNWIIAGLILLFTPFVQISGERDFVMRASIAPLFYLMTWCGAALAAKETPRLIRTALLGTLIIGSLTPLYEINRSIYRTFEYYFLLDESQRLQPDAEPAAHLEQGGAPEAEHPGALLADDIHTLAFLEDKLSKNYIANVRKSLYYRFLAPR